MAEVTTRGTGGETVELTDDPKLRHDWKRFEDDEYGPGATDIFAYNPYDPHNGPQCVRCGEGFCHHCEPDCYRYVCPKAVGPTESRKWTLCTSCESVVTAADEGACRCDFNEGWEKNHVEVIPTTAANVLSVEEARVLARFVSPPECISAAEVSACKEIARRLSGWATKEEDA